MPVVPPDDAPDEHGMVDDRPVENSELVAGSIPTAKENPMSLIDQKLAAIATAVGHVGKASKAEFGRTKYQYRGIDAVLLAVGPELNKHGVTCLAHDLEIAERTERKGRNGQLIYTAVKVTYVFTAAEDGSQRQYVAIGEAMDTGDKSFTKAQSVALRTCLINALHIPTSNPTLDTEHGEQHELGDRLLPPPDNSGAPESAPANTNRAAPPNGDTPAAQLARFTKSLEAKTTISALAPFVEWLNKNKHRPDFANFKAVYDKRVEQILEEGKLHGRPQPESSNR